MDELAEALAISLRGSEADVARTDFRSQVKTWGVTLPAVEPVVLDFGLGEFRTTGLIECWIANETRAGYCGKYLFVFDGQSCPLHHHKDKHETFFVVKGEVRMTCAGRERHMRVGDVTTVTPRTVHGFTGVGPALLLELSQPCLIEDNVFEDRRIPIGGDHDGARRQPHTQEDADH